MSLNAFFNKQEFQRRRLLAEIHKTILKGDKAIHSELGTMMGKEMILYKINGVFKYGLAGGKNHMSLHAMPIYCTPELQDKCKKLLPKASFQKGCINFKVADEIPLVLS